MRGVMMILSLRLPRVFLQQRQYSPLPLTNPDTHQNGPSSTMDVLVGRNKIIWSKLFRQILWKCVSKLQCLRYCIKSCREDFVHFGYWL